MRLQSRIGRGVLGLAVGWNFEGEGVGEVEADERFGGNLNLLTACDGVGSGSETAAGSGSDGCAFASAEDASEDGADGCSATDFFGGVFAATLALDAVWVGVDGEFFTAAIDAGELDGEKGTALVVGGLLHGNDAAGDGGALTDDDEAVGDDVGGDGAAEGLALLGGGAVEGLGDANRKGGAWIDGDVTEGWWGWWRWWEFPCGWWRRWGSGDLWGGIVCRWRGGVADDWRRLWFDGLLWLGFRRGRRRQWWRRGCGCGSGCGSLNGEVVDYGLDTWDLRGIGCGEGTSGFAADVAVEGGDAVLDCGLDGLGAEGAVTGDAALESGGQAGVIGGRRGAFAACEAEGEGNGQGGGGHDGAGAGEIFAGVLFAGVHRSPFLAANSSPHEHCKSLNRYSMRGRWPEVLL
jgi:hypothetical protein